MTGDQDFDKFREKKLNEKDAAKHEDDAAFFGTFKKKEDEDPNAPKKMKLSDLNIPGKDDRPDNVPKVGESLKLIDIALEPQKKPVPGHNPPHGARPPARPAGAPPAGRAPGPAPRPSAPPRPGAKPGQPPAQAKPSAPLARPAQGQRPMGVQPPRPGAPTPQPRSTGPVFKGRPGLPAPTPKAPPKRPPPDLSGFTDHAGTGGQEAAPQPAEDRFEDTTFVEATEHADPYEFKEQGSSSGLEFAEDRSASGRQTPPQPEKKASSSGNFKAMRPEDLRAKKFTAAPDPKKASTRRVKRGPLGR